MGIEALLSTQIIDTTTVGRAVMTAADAAAARTAVDAAATSHTHAASDITSGIIGTARLATGTANSTTYLRGDQTWASVSAGISSLNGLTDATQTFAVGTSGTDFAISSASGVHTFNLPDASATARGVVTTGTQTFAGDKTFSGTLFVGTSGGLANRIAFLQGPTWRHDIVQPYPEALLFRRNETGFVMMQAGTGDGGGSYTAGVMIAGGAFSWSGNSAITNSQDVANLVLARDAADVLAQRRGTNAQSYRIYNTFTSTTSFERLNIAWASNICTIEVTAGSGGGTLRGLRIGGATTSLVGLWGATPIAQPTTAVAAATRVGGGGTALTDTDTFDGYTLAQIVKALRNIGALA